MAFATVDELQARLDFEMSEDERGVAEGALDDLSIDAREYGRSTWTDENCPPAIKSLVLRAAARYMRNYDGFSESRAGDETVGWAEVDRQPDTAEFTPGEIKRIKRLAATPTFGTLTTYTWGTKRATREDLMVAAHGKDLPWVHPDEADWYRAVAGDN